MLYQQNPFKGGKTEIINMSSDSKNEKVEIFDEVDPYERQFRNFYNSVMKVETPKISTQESYFSAKTIEALLNSTKSNRLITLNY